MDYRERKMDLFDVDDDFYLVHCISSDYALGKGIAAEFRMRFPDLKNKLDTIGFNNYPDCIRIGRVFNLVTKDRYWDKPTYYSMRAALIDLKIHCDEMRIKKLAMPKIGSGLDCLSWQQVREIVMDIFKDMDIEILVCFREDLD